MQVLRIKNACHCGHIPVYALRLIYPGGTAVYMTVVRGEAPSRLGDSSKVAGEGNVSCGVLENGRNEDLLALLRIQASGRCILPG
jgi:hypothetical protein